MIHQAKMTSQQRETASKLHPVTACGLLLRLFRAMAELLRRGHIFENRKILILILTSSVMLLYTTILQTEWIVMKKNPPQNLKNFICLC